MKKLLMILLVVSIEARAKVLLPHGKHLLAQLSIKAQAKVPLPHGKHLLAQLMRYERLNYQQLLAAEASFLPANPLLQRMDGLGKITPQYLDQALEVTRSLVSARLGAIAASQDLTFDALYTPLEEIEVYTNKIWQPIKLEAKLHSSTELQAYTEQMDYLHWIKQQVLTDEVVHQKLRDLKASEALTAEQRRVVERQLQKMHNAGIALSEKNRDEVYVIHKTIASLRKALRTTYSTAASKAVLLLTAKEDVAGLPASFLQLAANNYNARKQDKQASADTGPWLIDMNGYSIFMRHSTRRDLRASLYDAVMTINGEGQIDQLTRGILYFKKRLANIFGYENYTDYIMSTRTLKDSSEVEALLDELHQAHYHWVKQDYASLTAYAQAHGHEDELAPYDIAFWRNRLAIEQIGKINPELLDTSNRASLADTIQGAFSLANKLFGIKIEESSEKTWHPDVSLYHIYDENSTHLGSFYLDPYRRVAKAGGAWVSYLDARGACAISPDAPVCYMVTNFNLPAEDKPDLLGVESVRTFMHEFGHVLHYVLTQTDYHALASVDNDMVEFSSKLMEGFMRIESLIRDVFPQPVADFFKQIIDSIDAGENISLSAAQTNTKALEKLFLSQADIELHRSYDPDGEESPADFLRRIANKMRILPADPKDEFAGELVNIMASSPYDNPFYYVYELGDIMARDVYTLFKENGLTDDQLRATGQLLWDKLFAPGGSKSTLELFEELRGRPLNIEASLQAIAKRKQLVD